MHLIQTWEHEKKNHMFTSHDDVAMISPWRYSSMFSELKNGISLLLVVLLYDWLVCITFILCEPFLFQSLCWSIWLHRSTFSILEIQFLWWLFSVIIVSLTGTFLACTSCFILFELWWPFAYWQVQVQISENNYIEFSKQCLEGQ